MPEVEVLSNHISDMASHSFQLVPASPMSDWTTRFPATPTWRSK